VRLNIVRQVSADAPPADRQVRPTSPFLKSVRARTGFSGSRRADALKFFVGKQFSSSLGYCRVRKSVSSAEFQLERRISLASAEDNGFFCAVSHEP
jgi:hypothetical protein